VKALNLFLARLTLLVTVAALLAGSVAAQETDAVRDPVLDAMLEEIGRSRALRIVNLDEPYFIQYRLDDARMFSVSATLGAILDQNRRQFRIPTVEVRVGDYSFDNANYLYTGLFAANATRGIPMPLEDNGLALRTFFWLATDRAYKGAVEAIARKRAALRSVNVSEEIADLWPAEPERLILEPASQFVDEPLWTERVRKLSGLFTEYPQVLDSVVSFSSVLSTAYMANSEGTAIRQPDPLAYLRIQAEGQAADGMLVRDTTVIQALSPDNLPAEQELENETRLVAQNLEALREAPVGDSYVGPVLVEGIASAQLFAQLLGRELQHRRRPVSEPGRSAPSSGSQLEGRLGSRVLPVWMDVVDDPTREQWNGKPLFGHYQIDMEGVRPQRLVLVEDGVLKAYLLTRQPVPGQTGSNGRARLPGEYGASTAGFGNLFINASETSPAAELRQKLLEMCKQRGKPYGIIIRKLDFPSSASAAEIRRMGGGGRRGRAAGLVSGPVLVYRIYPDGREELVRGMRLRNVDVRTLRDIVAASDESHRFDFMANTAPLSRMGAAGFVSANTVLAPSVLFEDIELEPAGEELPTLPVVPPPAVSLSM